ncbi:MAG: type II toxin-antitoxin system MqsR family toxin [Candidatus Sulfotelmatobacter sp.]
MQATYPLEQIKELFQQRNFRITETALQGAAMMNLLDEDIIDCVTTCLGDSHFYKTMAAERVPGLMQDVYKIRYEGERVYLKLQISKSGHAVVIAFKADESSA